MKVLLIQPPIQDFYDTEIRLQPLGLCMLKAAAGRHLPDVEVEVLDFHHGRGRRTIPLPKDLRYLRPYYAHQDLSPFATFRNYFHFGASCDAVGEEAAARKPDLVGISSLFTAYHREALACADAVKERLDVPILMGGAHVSALPLSALSGQSVDFIIRGEGERPFVELLRVLLGDGDLKDVPNLGFKREGRPILNPMGKGLSLDSLPPADFSDFPPGRYCFEGRPICFVTVSRGCPHRCSFCSVHATFGPGYRTRHPEHVLSEMKQRFAEGYRVFDFEDDNLTFARENFLRLLDLIRTEFAAKGIRLTAMNGISFQSLDRDLLEQMKDAGFADLNLSLVSSEGPTLDRLNRPHRLSRFLEVVEDARALGFDIVSYQIIGLPFEPLQSMGETMALLATLPVRIGASVFYLTPGAPMAPLPEDISQPDMVRARSTAMAAEGDDFERDHVFTLFITARIINFLKDIPLQGGNASLGEALSLAESLGGRARIGAELLRGFLKEGRLCAATKAGPKPITRFKSDLFFQVLRKAGEVRTRQGAAAITLDDSLPRAS